MAISIKQRGKKYTFTFYYKDENGINRQQYEAYSNLDKADERAKMIEFLKWKDVYKRQIWNRTLSVWNICVTTSD